MATIANRRRSWIDRALCRALLIPLAAALLCGGCSLERARFQQQTTVSAPHATGSGVSVQTRNGSVALRKSATADGKVSISATLHMVSQERLAQATIQANRNKAGVLEVSAKPPEGGWRSTEGCDFDIKVPDASGVELTTGNGSIQIEGLSGSAKLETSNGRITIDGHDGPVVAQTSNGRIEAGGVNGSITAGTSNGSVTVRRAPKSAGPANIHTSNGSVTLELSAAFLGELDVGTNNGSIHVPSSPPAGVSKFSSRVDRHSAHLSVGEGGPASSIQTSNGSVTVKYGGQ